MQTELEFWEGTKLSSSEGLKGENRIAFLEEED